MAANLSFDICDECIGERRDMAMKARKRSMRLSILSKEGKYLEVRGCMQALPRWRGWTPRLRVQAHEADGLGATCMKIDCGHLGNVRVIKATGKRRMGGERHI